VGPPVPRQPPEGRLADRRRRAGQTGNPFNIVTNITTITGTATVGRISRHLPSIVATPNNDKNGFPVSYQWFDGQTTVCDPRIAAGTAGSCTSSSIFALPYNARRGALR
jgi:hypothetical protein